MTKQHSQKTDASQDGKIDVAGQFHVLYTKLPNREPLASIPFPSSMEGPASSTRVIVDFQTGNLKKRCKNVKFITDATLREMNDAEFRVACDRNAALLNTLSFDSGSLWGFTPALSDTLRALPDCVKKVRILGGDLLCTEMLECIFTSMEHSDKTLYVQTSRVDILNDLAIADYPDNVLVYCRIPNMSDELNLHTFPYARLDKKSDHTDLETYPDTGKEDLSYKPDPDSDTALRTGKPWWQRFN